MATWGGGRTSEDRFEKPSGFGATRQVSQTNMSSYDCYGSNGKLHSKMIVHSIMRDVKPGICLVAIAFTLHPSVPYEFNVSSIFFLSKFPPAFETPHFFHANYFELFHLHCAIFRSVLRGLRFDRSFISSGNDHCNTKKACRAELLAR